MRVRKRFPAVLLRFACAALWSACMSPLESLALPAFPGAVGFGSEATGGSIRAGAGTPQVLKVTNLNDSGEGSLRACIDTSGPRVCVFEVGGYITLDSPLVIRNSNITIAGQTAPSPGIHLRNGRNKNSVLQTNASNIIIQHLGIRAGDDGCTVGSCDQRRSLEVKGGSNMIFDHLSLTWGIDETFDTYGGSDPTNVTVSNTIIGENLRHSFHTKGRTTEDGHAYGTMINTLSGSEVQATFTGNLLAFSYYRNPLLKSGWNLEFLNNVVYGWGGGSSDTLYQEGTNDLIFAGNYYKRAPWSAQVNCLTGSSGRVYAPTGSNVCAAGLGGTSTISPQFAGSGAAGAYNRNPHDTLAQVFASAGMRPWDRYSADQRMVDESRSGGGSYKDCVNQCGQGITNVPVDPSGHWPALPGTSRPLAIPANPHALQPSGYSALEEWLFAFAGTTPPATPRPTATPAPQHPARMRCVLSIARKTRHGALLQVTFSEKVRGFTRSAIHAQGAVVTQLQGRPAAARYRLRIAAKRGSHRATVSVHGRTVRALRGNRTNTGCRLGSFSL